MTPEELQNSKEFMSSTPADQIAFLRSQSPEFANSHPDEQAAFLAHITNQPMQEKPKAEPGTLSKIGSMVANRVGIPATPEDVSEASSALGSDLGGMVKSIPSMIWKTSAPGMAVEGIKKGVTGMRALRSGQQTPEQQHEEEQKQSGYGTMYRKLGTPLAEGVGVNLRGMEESAKEGSPGGVIGHAAAVPTAIAATYGLGKITPPMLQGINRGRTALAERIVSPLVYEGTGEGVADLRAGQSAARGLVKEGMMGTKARLLDKIDSRLNELKPVADKILENHKNSRTLLNVEKEIDGGIDSAIEAEQKAGATEVIPRLENLRTALKTKFGKIEGTPREINDLKTDIQKTAAGRGAYKNTVPVEGSTANALRDIANRIRSRVDTAVPEAAEINGRMSDLLDAPSPLTKKLVQERGGARMPGEGVIREALHKTAGSAPVRTGVARMLTLGQKAGIPKVSPYVPPRVAGLLGPGRIGLGSSMEGIEPLSPTPPVLERPYNPPMSSMREFGKPRPSAKSLTEYELEQARKARK